MHRRNLRLHIRRKRHRRRNLRGKFHRNRIPCLVRFHCKHRIRRIGPRTDRHRHKRRQNRNQQHMRRRTHQAHPIDRHRSCNPKMEAQYNRIRRWPLAHCICRKRRALQRIGRHRRICRRYLNLQRNFLRSLLTHPIDFRHNHSRHPEYRIDQSSENPSTKARAISKSSGVVTLMFWKSPSTKWMGCPAYSNTLASSVNSSRYPAL